MSYQIPQQLQYKEKIMFGLTFPQILWASLFILIIVVILKLPLNSTAKFVIALFPSFIGILFTSSMLIEIIFSLDGLGLLGYESVLNRDFPVIFASLYIFTLIGLLTNLICDITYKLIDPRINFENK